MVRKGSGGEETVMGLGKGRLQGVGVSWSCVDYLAVPRQWVGSVVLSRLSAGVR